MDDLQQPQGYQGVSLVKVWTLVGVVAVGSALAGLVNRSITDLTYWDK
ncbi:Hypothetical Protein OBI_RACECAR_225 [Arthrobacter phage Racecar]|nr:hypothetical protein PBI_RACECAR_17 [Arthrobacter phage Racecar]QFG12929.1 hypothetical protein PBI_MIMI_17 [Arthrobacter phage Mimi]